MTRLLTMCMAVILAAPAGAVVGQVLAPAVPDGGVTLSSGPIDRIPPLARAVMTGNLEKVTQLLEKKGENLNEPVRAKPGARAEFTPLIIAAALSEPKIVKLLIDRGAKVTMLDDYHRSAFWYAALRQDVKVTEILAAARSASEVVKRGGR